MFNTYIHNKTGFNGNLNRYCIRNKVNTEWGDISLVKATLYLFYEAFNNHDNEYFVLLSDTTIPLCGPDALHHKLTNIDRNMVHIDECDDEYALPMALASERFEGLVDKTFFRKQDFAKQDQWLILKRETVKFFLENNFLKVFGNKFFIPDEHYFVNIMNKFNIPYLNKLTTFVYWEERFTQDAKGETYKVLYPKTYDVTIPSDIIRKATDEGCFFMRKVTTDCMLPSYFDKI